MYILHEAFFYGNLYMKVGVSLKRKTYYIVYAIMQIIFGIDGYVSAKDIISSQLKDFDFSKFPQEIVNLCSVSFISNIYKCLMIISIIIGIILLIIVLKNKVIKKKKLVIALVIVSIFTTFSLVSLFAIVTLFCLFTDKRKTDVIEQDIHKKKLEVVPDVLETRKDRILGVVLIIIFFAQLIFIPLIYKVTHNDTLSTILYEIVILAATILIFKDRYKHDFLYLKNNFKEYVGFAFKHWFMMFGILIFVVTIQVLLGASGESGNQEALKTLPFLYLIPGTIIYAPIVEEAVFRGSIRRLIKNDVVFIIVSGAVFGLLHTFLSEDGLYNIIIYSLNYVAMGACLAYSYVKTNNIYISMMIHAIQNTLGVIAIVIQLSA